jgi:DNA modification methylase
MKMNKYTLINDDRMKLLKKLKDNSVQLIITSPPYNIGKSYEKRIPLNEYIEQQEETLIECYRVLKDKGSLCWQIGNYIDWKSNMTPLDIPIFNICNDLGLKLRNRIVWHYGHGLHSSNKFSGRYQTIMWFSKSDKYIFNLDAVRVPQKYPGKLSYKGPNKGKYSGNINGKNPSDVWGIPNIKSNHIEKTIHPCQFPIELAERLILALSNKNDLVIDPYAGVGTTLCAALKNKRRSAGSEIKKKYINITKKRIKLLKKGKLPFRPLFSSIKIAEPNSKLYRRN